MTNNIKSTELILNKVVDTDYYMSVNELEYLFNCTSTDDIELIRDTADSLNKRLNNNKVSYIHNLNVNFTNICDSYCAFCGFKRKATDQDAYILDLEDFEQKIETAKNEHRQEICLQGGLYSNLQIKGLKSVSLLDIYAELLAWIKTRWSNVHIHAYSPEEIDFLNHISGKSHTYILEYLKDYGLDSMPGTAAEILSDDIRAKICSKKLNTKKWLKIIKLAHQLQIPSTATILFGHIESNKHRAIHLNVLRELQKETNGLTEFIPLAFIPNKTNLKDKINPLTSTDRLKMLALSRLYFKELIPNIQASWVKQGVDETKESLHWGVNDIGGTLGNEQITHAAGGRYGRFMEVSDLVSIIESQGKKPILRDTIYNYVEDKTKIML